MMSAHFPLLLFIAFALTTKFLGDWFFWTHMFLPEIKETKVPIKDILLSKPESIRAILDMVFDLIQDIVLIYVALSVNAAPAWVFFVYLGSQAVAAAIQGIIADRWDRKAVRVFSMVVTVFAIATSMGILGVEFVRPYVQMFGLASFSVPIQALIVLGIKGLFSSTSVIAKAEIAECIAMAENA